MEPHSKYLILVDNKEEEITFKAVGESIFQSAFQNELVLNNGVKIPAIIIGRDTATSPGFPFIVELEPTTPVEINLRGIMRATSRDQYNLIPVIE